MATQIQVGQRVRINEKYALIGFKDQVGTEFVVTGVVNTPWRDSDGVLYEFYVTGDPRKQGVWANYLDAVPTKAHTTTLIPTVLNWVQQDRIVQVTSGKGSISLTVRPNPAGYGSASGSTTLEPYQAELLAYDLLARVAEIRAVSK